MGLGFYEVAITVFLPLEGISVTNVGALLTIFGLTTVIFSIPFGGAIGPLWPQTHNAGRCAYRKFHHFHSGRYSRHFSDRLVSGSRWHR